LKTNNPAQGPAASIDENGLSPSHSPYDLRLSPTVIDIMGWVGAVLLLLAYALVSSRKAQTT
jgi:hypothetical protein